VGAIPGSGNIATLSGRQTIKKGGFFQPLAKARVSAVSHLVVVSFHPIGAARMTARAVTFNFEDWSGEAKKVVPI
jgi:hypothetical protein